MDNKEIRRLNLMAIVDSYKSIKQFAEAADMNESHVSQIKIKSSQIGDKLARKLEDKFGKNHGWMDTPHGFSVSD